jgi:hypothetical protein
MNVVAANRPENANELLIPTPEAGVRHQSRRAPRSGISGTRNRYAGRNWYPIRTANPTPIQHVARRRTTSIINIATAITPKEWATQSGVKSFAQRISVSDQSVPEAMNADIQGG